MFKQFHIKDLGTSPAEFNLESFVEYENTISKDFIELTGSTLPFLMKKKDYISVGGWDESYPGPWVVDWEFFMKCEINQMSMMRTYNTHVYHFGSISTQSQDKSLKEAQCAEYFKYKWGFYPTHDPETNSKVLP
jgi:predicted glycosyltransferase involved in capsule biosynthesis